MLKNKKRYYNTELKKECYIKDYNSDNMNEKSPIYRVNSKKAAKQEIESFLKKTEGIYSKEQNSCIY